MSEDWSWVISFANSIVGVSVLAFPFCFYKCGVIISLALLVTSATFTKLTCEFLLRTSQVTRKSSLEGLALHLLGPVGKLVTEISTILLLIGILVACQVVIGDLAPSIIHYAFGFEETWRLRTIVMVLSSMAMIPLTLMRNVQSLAGMNALSMGFYSIFVLVVILFSLPNFFKFEWWTKLHFWRPEGFFQCLPITFIGFSCQTQVFIMYQAIPDPSLLKMKSIIDRAINLCLLMYSLVGLFGYIAFYEHGIHGDILHSVPSGIIAQALKTGFWMSVLVSIPLLTFPLRAAINSLLFSRRRKQQEIISSAADYIPQDRFTYITLALVGGTLTVGVLVPKIETVLSLTGALVGTFVCFVLPAALYLLVLKSDDTNRLLTQVVLILSIFAMVTSTVTVISSQQSSHVEHHLNERDAQEQIARQTSQPVMAKISVPVLEFPTQPPYRNPNALDVIKIEPNKPTSRIAVPPLLIKKEEQELTDLVREKNVMMLPTEKSDHVLLEQERVHDEKTHDERTHDERTHKEAAAAASLRITSDNKAKLDDIITEESLLENEEEKENNDINEKQDDSRHRSNRVDREVVDNDSVVPSAGHAENSTDNKVLIGKDNPPPKPTEKVSDITVVVEQTAQANVAAKNESLREEKLSPSRSNSSHDDTINSSVKRVRDILGKRPE